MLQFSAGDDKRWRLSKLFRNWSHLDSHFSTFPALQAYGGGEEACMLIRVDNIFKRREEDCIVEVNEA